VDQTSEQRRVFDLATLVNEVVMTLKPTLKKLPVKITVDITDSIELNSYPGPLGQIITNLINNAIIHGLPGSVDDQICISAKRRGDNLVHIEIQDNGRGIPAEHLDVIFNPFFTTKLGQGGSGLGLNIAHNMTENILKGRISVHSLPERGATFSLDIPLSPSV
jgi:signal transduction histidine kinase